MIVKLGNHIIFDPTSIINCLYHFRAPLVNERALPILTIPALLHPNHRINFPAFATVIQTSWACTQLAIINSQRA